MRAEHCAQMAAQAKEEFHRKNFQQLANMWAEMAQKAENRSVAAEEVREDATFNDRKIIQDALATIKLAEAG